MKKYIGSKEFYKYALKIAIPIMIQNGITNFVSMLDNIMVGRIGEEQMSSVAIVNNLIFVFNLFIFGGVSGAGIYTAQFYGKGNNEGVRHTFRFKIIVAVLITSIALGIFGIFGPNLIALYLKGDAGVGNIDNILNYGTNYLHIMMVEMLFFAITQVYADTLRETGETVIPMKAGMVAVCINLVLNYVLIYGKFGAPKLGVFGAAIATCIARLVEVGIIIIWTHSHKEKNPFIVGVYKSLAIPSKLVKDIIARGLPLLLNEGLWAGGIAVLNQCYSKRGVYIVTAFSISTTITNVFNIVFIALGSSVAIIVGQKLGAGKYEEAKDSSRKLIVFSVLSCIVIGAIMTLFSGVFPQIYNASDIAKGYATKFIIIAAVCMPMHAYLHSTYFTLRSGGKTIITFLFDSVYMWIISIPLAYCLITYTTLSIIPLFIIVSSIDIVKCILGFILLKRGTWMQNIVQE